MSSFLYSPKFRYRLIRHLLFFWLTVILFVIILFIREPEKTFFTVFYTVFLNALFFFSYAYITIFVIIPEFVLKNRFVWAALIFLLVGIGLSAVKLLSSSEIFYSTLSPENIERTGLFNLRYIIINTKDMSFIVALFCIAKYAKEYLHNDKIRKELEERNKEAQNKLLQSQFNPHFLFNTINNLYALSLLDPDKTNRVISRMKSVLEYIIDESQKKFVGIANELDLLENYIQLEKLRYGTRLKIEIFKNGNYSSEKIPPMVFFVLVENCFAHGSSLDAGNPWIRIELSVDDNEIMFRTENSKPINVTSVKSRGRDGSSLSNLSKRLGLLYWNNYSLDLKDLEGTFIAMLKIRKDSDAFNQ